MMTKYNKLMGLIVEVRSKTHKPIDSPAQETFVGYFGSMSDRQADGSYRIAHIRETHLLDADAKKRLSQRYGKELDAEKMLFKYGQAMEFYVDDVQITARALRGPAYINRYLSEDLQKYETWTDFTEEVIR